MTLTQLLENTVRQYPDRLALKCKNEQITYNELYQKSLSLANTLVHQGVKKGDRVGFLFNKSIESVISIYGILLSGGCYVPLDIKSPDTRLSRILNDCDIQIVITSKKEKGVELLSETGVHTVITTATTPETGFDKKVLSWDKAIQNNDQGVLPEIEENDTSYILYTSGSTGVPKGIMHTHRSATSFALWAAKEFGLQETDVVSNHAPYHFDLSTFDLFSSCAVGATMIIIPEFLVRFPASVVKLIADEKISVWYSVPSALVQMLQRGSITKEKMDPLRVILFAGEEFPVKFLQGLMDITPNAQLANLYGPTETNVCTYYHVDRNQEYNETLPIGMPCADFEYKIVDDNEEEVRKGVQGELLVTGPHLMKGYWNMEDLNAKTLVKTQNKVFYKTGDFVKEVDGNLMFLGRKDRQIKLRGFRIELDEIEHLVQNITGVEEAVVYVVENENVEVIKTSITLAEPKHKDKSEEFISKQLVAQLPNYAVPSIIEILEMLPRTSSGKIDRQKLISGMISI